MIYLHIDEKSTINVNEIESLNLDHVKVIKTFRIDWGGYNHLLAIIALLKLAVNNNHVSYIHIISGQDMLIRSHNEFEQRFSETKLIYMNCIDKSSFSETIRHRLERFVITSNLDSRKRIIRCINSITYIFQSLTGGKRRGLGGITDVYKGVVWCSFPIDVAHFVLQYIDETPQFMKDLRHTNVSEEFFFQTLIMNSKFRKNVIPNNLRYTDWRYKNGSSPAILDETDFYKIINSDAFFARKIDSVISSKLTALIEDSFYTMPLNM